MFVITFLLPAEEESAGLPEKYFHLRAVEAAYRTLPFPLLSFPLLLLAMLIVGSRLIGELQCRTLVRAASKSLRGPTALFREQLSFISFYTLVYDFICQPFNGLGPHVHTLCFLVFFRRKRLLFSLLSMSAASSSKALQKPLTMRDIFLAFLKLIRRDRSFPIENSSVIVR